MRGRRGQWLLCVLGLLLAFGSASWANYVAATNNGNWSTSAIWTNGAPPTAGDDVFIPANRTVTNDVPTPVLGSLTNSGTFVFIGTNNVLNATNVVLFSGTVTHGIQTITNAPWSISNCVYIVCSNLLVSSIAAIDVTGKGYGGNPGIGVNGTRGYGPGGGINWNNCGGGGGYGGAGGFADDQYATATGGPPYGSAQVPLDAGSGGAGSYSSQQGASGGGLVRIEATNVTLNGTITAAGGNGTGSSVGGGAGGGIYITCRTFAGTNGTVSANGGYATPGNNAGGGGGGGRIAILYDTAAQSSLSAKPSGLIFSAIGGMNGKPSKWGLAGRGRPGTIYMANSALLSDQFRGGQLAGLSSWAPGSLLLTNSAAIFPAGFSLSVTNDVGLLFSELQFPGGPLSIGGSLMLNATSALTAWSGPGSGFGVGSNLTLNLSSLTCSNGTPTNAFGLSVGGNLTMTNAGLMYVYSAITSPPSVTYGALVTVTGTTYLANGSWVYLYSDPTNGGSPFVQLADLTISTTNAGFDANGKGYSGGIGIGVGQTNGFGPGGGTRNGNTGGGGGYGGQGGIGHEGTASSLSGPTYGSAQAPIDPGSGGALGYGSNGGGPGGGLIRIQATNIVLNGSIMANGNPAPNNAGGGGAGGGINIVCRTLTGTNGTMSANGLDDTASSNGGGGGGGGRIAVSYDTTAQSNLTSGPQGLILSARGA